MVKSGQTAATDFGYKKTPEILYFQGFFVFVGLDYLLENCGARRAPFNPYSLRKCSIFLILSHFCLELSTYVTGKMA